MKTKNFIGVTNGRQSKLVCIFSYAMDVKLFVHWLIKQKVKKVIQILESKIST